MSFDFPFPTWNKIAWFVVLGTAGVLEFMGIFRAQDATLTEIIKASVVLPLRIMIVSWLGWHFVVSDIVKMIAGK